MTYISSASVLSSVRQSVLQAQAGLAQAQTEVSSGVQADLGIALGARTGSSVSMKNEIDSLAGYIASNAGATTRLDVTAGTLATMTSAARAMSASLVTASSAGGTTAGLQASGAAGLGALLAGLNVSSGGQYVFGGINSGAVPIVATADTAVANADAAFGKAFGFSASGADASAVTGDAMTGFLDGAFADQFGEAAWSSEWSQASNTTISTTIAPSQKTATSVSANASAFRQIAQAYTMLSAFTGSNLGADARAAVVAKATSLVNSGLAALNDLGAQVGTSQKAISAANAGLDAQSTVLKGQVSDLESVDTYALSNRVTSLQTQLQASYELTSRLQQLSLVNYLK